MKTLYDIYKAITAPKYAGIWAKNETFIRSITLEVTNIELEPALINMLITILDRYQDKVDQIKKNPNHTIQEVIDAGINYLEKPLKNIIL